MMKGTHNTRCSSEMGLEDLAARHPASLSGGQKQRLLLALAAESGRRLMVFEEPTSGLDGYHTVSYTHL